MSQLRRSFFTAKSKDMNHVKVKKKKQKNNPTVLHNCKRLHLSTNSLRVYDVEKKILLTNWRISVTRTFRTWPTCPQRWIMKAVCCVICSILMLMDYWHKLQAKFEGYLIILFLTPPPWVLAAESHSWIPKIGFGFSLLVVIAQLSLPRTRFM